MAKISSAIQRITYGVILSVIQLFTYSFTINGWLRDFLWAQASQVIQSYGSSLSAYGLFFLGAHFVWAFSLGISKQLNPA